MSFTIISALNSFDGVFFISEWYRKQFNLKTDTCIIRDSLDENVDKLLKEIKTGKSVEYKIAYVGRDAIIKGFGILLEALKSVSRKTTVILAGRYSESACAKIASLNNPNVTVMNLGELKNIYSALLNADVLICPSTYAHQLRPIFETGYVDVPMITTQFDELAENIKDGYNGLTFTQGSAEALSDKIEKLRDDRDLLKKLGTNNHKHTMEYHSFPAVSKALNEFINEQ